MLPSMILVLLTILGTNLATHYEWADYDRWNYSQDDDSQKNDQEEQFQGYPTNYPPVSDRPVDITTDSTVPDHRVLLKGLFQQVLGSNFTSPGLTDLAFLSSARLSLPLKSQVVEYQQNTYPSAPQGPIDPQAENSFHHYELAEYIQPPPLPVTHYNYYQ